VGTPPIFTEAQAEEFLRPFKPTLAGAIRGAFRDWGAMLMKAPQETAGLSPYVRARYVHDRTVFHLNKAEVQESCPGLHLVKRHGLYTAELRDQMVLKLKKLDGGLRSRNIQTGQTQAFDTQSLLIPAETGRTTNATSGYVPDALSGSLTSLVVVCWNGRNRLWAVSLDEEQGEAGGPVVEIPAEPAVPRAPRTKIVKPSERKQAE
jgi:hypothetical protein